MKEVVTTEFVVQTGVLKVPTVSRRIWRATWTSTEFRFGLVVFLVLMALALLWPEFSPFDATKMSIRERLLPPVWMEKGTWGHPIGTDHLGRDLLLRSMIGLRYSLLIGICVTFLMFIAGCGLGIASGFKAGLTDTILMRICDVQLSIPVIILAITILAVSRPTPAKIILVLALAGWPMYARIARSTALAERGKEYVRGARVLGASDLRIMLTLLVPTIMPPIAFVAVLDVARMMIFEAILGFLGLGIQPPTPTFGTIISDGRSYMLVQWWIASMPGLFLFLVLGSINLMGAAIERARRKVLGGVS